MSLKSFLYLFCAYWLIVGGVAYFYLDTDTAETAETADVQADDRTDAVVVAEPDHAWVDSELADERALTAAVAQVAGVISEADSADGHVAVVDRFPNESKVRDVLALMKAGLASGDLSDVAYEAYLLDLESLLLDSDPHYAEMWALIQSELSFQPGSDVKQNTKDQQLLDDVQRKFGFVWGQADPPQSLQFARQAGPHVLAGWLAGQMDAGNDFLPLLESFQLTPAPEVYWEALMDIAKTDTLFSLDTVLDQHMDSMTLDKWKELLFSRGNSGDTALATWFEANIGQLAGHPNFDEVEVIRMLRRFDLGEGPFLVSSDLAQVEAAKRSKNYAQTAQILENLSVLYGDVIDAAAAGRFPVDWSKQDFEAASNWVVAHADDFSDYESMESMLGTMYRHKAVKDPDYALHYGMQIEDEGLRGLVLSNTVIPQLEKHGTDYPVEWVSGLSQGFAKQRSMAGYVLGLSRNQKETTLEAQVKFQFLKDEFDLATIQNQVLQSQLSTQDKMKVVELLNTY